MGKTSKPATFCNGLKAGTKMFWFLSEARRFQANSTQAMCRILMSLWETNRIRSALHLQFFLDRYFEGQRVSPESLRKPKSESFLKSVGKKSNLTRNLVNVVRRVLFHHVAILGIGNIRLCYRLLMMQL